jgi:hypothetical protein
MVCYVLKSAGLKGADCRAAEIPALGYFLPDYLKLGHF